MNGQGFSAFMDGMSGGYSLGKGIKAGGAKQPAMTPEAQASSAAGASQEGYSGDLSNFTPGASGAAEAAAPTSESGGLMDKIGGWLGEATKSLPLNGGIAGGVLRHAGDSIGGKLLAGGPGATILGKLIK